MGTTAFARGALLLVLGSGSVLSSTPVLAEEQTLSLSRVIEYSLQNNGDLKAFREGKGIRDSGKVRAGLLPNPTFDLEAGTGALTGSSDESSLSIGVSQEFLLAAKREKRRLVADHELEIYRWQLADRERLIRAEVQAAFYDVILAEQRIALADRAIALNRQLLDVTRERLAAGDIPELEMNLVKVELARSEGARIDVARALNQNRAKLLSFMGVPIGEQYTLSGKLESAPILTKTAASLKELALSQRPDLKALEAEKYRGEAEIALARAEGVPNLTAGVAVRRDTTAMEIGGAEGKDTAYTIGLKLSIPIPLFDRNQAGVQEAQARRSSVETPFAGRRQGCRTGDRNCLRQPSEQRKNPVPVHDQYYPPT
ncbi:cobalt-zinc-cadmium resistance protein CzcC [Geobacter sp. OR-1]|uniref:TolC family protein n=1 Tax=Geobacter sp. OR-1 TaxID=1266765 RepID=UPI0005431D83|nr:TolC family protein [Geobacter sp. OR-1]GAM07917.1 cobalt-zinc-cadmium resistance protein CzcC [Geobacter sp. OR-1]